LPDSYRSQQQAKDNPALDEAGCPGMSLLEKSSAHYIRGQKYEPVGNSMHQRSASFEEDNLR
jgi:hypothetical protein